MTSAQEVLQNCTIEGMVIKLPQVQLERKVYQDTAKSLELIGGKWKGGKIAGFVFNEDPTDLLAQIANGEKRNIKKEYQFFATPAHLADMLVQMANPNSNDRILEPSAGRGAIIDAIYRHCSPMRVGCYELMPLNQTFLTKNDKVVILGDDFLAAPENDLFDKIIANPPFSGNRDIDHIYKMYRVLKDGGRIVTIASKHWQNSKNKKEQDFRTWLQNHNGDVREIPTGEFKESGTTVATCIIVIDK